MGQRLNIEIHDKGKCLANCYYHWGAYTGYAASLTKTILDFYFHNIKGHLMEDDKLLSAILMLQSTGSLDFRTMKMVYAGLGEDYDYISKKYPGIKFNKFENRSAGIISCTEKGMEDTRKFQEGYISIDIGYETISFDVLSIYDISEYLEYCIDDLEDDEDIEVEDSKDVELDFSTLMMDTGNLSFKDFEIFNSFLIKTSEPFFINSENGNYIATFIE